MKSKNHRNSRPSPRRKRKCAPICGVCETFRAALTETERIAEAFEQEAIDAKAELTEAKAENRKLQAFKDLTLGLAQRDLAGNLHIRAEDAKNCLQ